jgi:hypothetical protein
VARATTFKYTVTVSNPGSGNRYYIDGNLQQYVVLFPGCTYEFNQDDSSNSGHPLRFATAADAAGSTEYTTGVTTSGTPGSATAWTKIEVTSDTPHTLYYYCTQHSGMGSEVNTPENFSISNTNDRMICGGGDTAGGSFSNTIDILQLRSKGNASDYGDLSLGRQSLANGCISSTTRGLFYAGDDSGPAVYVNTIDYITMASVGNATDFGDATADDSGGGGFSNATRGGRGGGFTGTSNPFASNIIDYVTIATTGNASDFGDLSSVRYGISGLSSSTRGIFGGGAIYTGSTVYTNVIEYITIASTGNATDFGDLLAAGDNMSGASSATRGVFMGGVVSAPNPQNVMQYITIASTGNAQDFGDLATAIKTAGGNSNGTTGIVMGGLTPSLTNQVQEITIATTGNAADFGDLTQTRASSPGTVSPNHGGLQ